MKRHALYLTFVLSLAAGCSFFNFGYDGHPCSPVFPPCLNGYACNAQNICVTAAAASCTPACDELHQCVMQQCISKCTGVTCEPAAICLADAGACQQQPVNGQLGGACAQDADCGTTGLICLLPYGGQLSGVCTSVCTSDSTICTASGQVCTTFTSDAPGSTIQLCADPSLKPCAKDSDCNSASSDFTCVVAEATTSSFGSISVSVCAPPVAGSLPPGQACTFTGAPCASGLCIQAGGTSSTARYCSTPCTATSDCMGLFSGVDPSMLHCEPVTIALQALTKRTRANLCIIGSPSYDAMCGATGGSNCNADAPSCVMNAAGTGEVCAPYCTDGLVALQCDTTEGNQLTCNTTTQTCY